MTNFIKNVIYKAAKKPENIKKNLEFDNLG